MPEIDNLADDVRSFVTFALAMKPGSFLHRRADDNGPTISLTITAEASDADRADAEVASLEPVMERYQPLRPYLNAMIDAGESVPNCTPTTNFEAGTEYRMVRISQAQFEIAKEVASRLDRIHVLHSASYPAEASKEFDLLHGYLAEQRQALVGEFGGVKFSDAVATFGSDRLANVRADGDCSGLVIFIVIEIFIG